MLSGLKKEYYDKNRGFASGQIYNDHAMYLSDVTFTRNGSIRKAGVVVIAAPNRTRALENHRSPEGIDQALGFRIEALLRIAAANGADTLICNAFGCGALERLLEKQVAARVAGQPQFGEHSQLRAVQRRAPHGGDGLLCVERAVGHAQRRRDRAGFEKTVDHDVITLSKSKTRSAKRSGRRGKFARAADRN